MKIYLTVLEDRQCGVIVDAFTIPSAAIAKAKERAKLGSHGRPVPESEFMPGYLYYVRYAPSSSVHVEEVELHGSVARA